MSRYLILAGREEGTTGCRVPFDIHFEADMIRNRRLKYVGRNQMQSNTPDYPVFLILQAEIKVNLRDYPSKYSQIGTFWIFTNI